VEKAAASHAATGRKSPVKILRPDKKKNAVAR
jgi:hypothetical protein